jgi:hypothetical protein
MPHWRVPSFIRSCTAICVLERVFPITIHSPMVPREVLACGGCLVVSGEIAQKQPYQLVDGETVLVVPNPKHHDALRTVLGRVITEPARAREIGTQARALAVKHERFNVYIDRFEELLERVRARAGRRGVPARTTGGEVEETASGLATLLGGRVTHWANEIADRARSENPFTLGLKLWTMVEQHAAELDGQDPGVVESALRYQRARIWSLFDDGSAVQREPHGARTWPQYVEPHARPRRSERLRLETFPYDVTPLFTLDDSGSSGQVRREVVHVCFYKPPNLDSKEFRIDTLTKTLLELCDGSRDLAQLVDELQGQLAAGAGNQLQELRRAVADAIERLYREGLIVFVGAAA